MSETDLMTELSDVNRRIYAIKDQHFEASYLFDNAVTPSDILESGQAFLDVESEKCFLLGEKVDILEKLLLL